MPDDDREWTLDKKPRGEKGQNREEDTVKAVQCPECFRVFEPDERRICPFCGTPLPKKERDIKQKSAELEKIEGFVLHYDSPSECKSYAELQAYGKKKGYKPGWSYYQARSRGLIHDRA